MLTDFLPTTKKELELRAWDCVDVVLFSGDAYIDHPAFAASVIGRVIEAEALRVAIVPQPNWRDDLRDFHKMGRPRMFFAVTAGNMDSMVNHYTAAKRLRSDDAYTPDGKAGMRPDYATITYCKILKKLFPDVPVLIGGIEASMRRLTHYDYWTDKLMPSILVDAQADLLVYGNGEKPLREIIKRLRTNAKFSELTDIQQTAYLTNSVSFTKNDIVLNSHENSTKNKKTFALDFAKIETESNKIEQSRIIQPVGNNFAVVNPPFPPLAAEELDYSFDLPYTRLPHPKYKGKHIPAFEMIKFSVTTHRGCFGGCAFCTISAHQGKHISSRSEKSVLNEVKKIAEMPDFKGYLSDLGGPSANMYAMRGENLEICRKCAKPSCIFPVICKNLDTNHQKITDLYNKVDALPEIKKSFIGSGIRYDMLFDRNLQITDADKRQYIEEVIARHVSGRLKVAPEHTSDKVLNVMRKPPFAMFEKFKQTFDKICAKYSLNQQIIPYFIAGHPACTAADMAELAVRTKALNFHLEQVQDFTPTPMTLASAMYYTGINPYTMEIVYSARTKDERDEQHQFFFWYKAEYRRTIEKSLRKAGRLELLKLLVKEQVKELKKNQNAIFAKKIKI